MVSSRKRPSRWAAKGKPRTRYATVRRTKKEAQRELSRLLAEVDNGMAVDPLTVTVAEYLRQLLDAGEGLAEYLGALPPMSRAADHGRQINALKPQVPKVPIPRCVLLPFSVVSC